MIPSQESDDIDFQAIAQGMKVAPDSTRYHILKAFCEGKNATMTDVKALIQRMECLEPEQLNILKVIIALKREEKCRRAFFPPNSQNLVGGR